MLPRSTSEITSFFALHRRRNVARTVGGIAVVALALASACGGGDDGAAGPGKGGNNFDAAAGSGGQSGKGGTGGAVITMDGGGSAGTSAKGGAPGDAGEETCGATAINIEAIPPDMLVVFDRSCSMRRFYNSDQPVFGTGPDDPSTRWFMAREALNQIMAAYETRIRFGLLVFPRPNFGCGDTPTVNVMPALTNKDEVLSALQKVQPFDACLTNQQPKETPTGAAINAALDAPIYNLAERDTYVLLMTDGAASCGESASSLGQIVKAIKQKGAKTAVVGFGDVVEGDAVAMLDAMGQAGGLKPSAPWYWLAQNPTDLKSAIDDIVSDIVSCKFKLKQAPPDPDKVYAYLDGQSVPADDNNGWTYDAGSQTVTFHGSACKKLQDGKVKNVSIVFGCPDPSCMPSTEVCDGYDNDCDGKVDEENICPK